MVGSKRLWLAVAGVLLGCVGVLLFLAGIGPFIGTIFDSPVDGLAWSPDGRLLFYIYDYEGRVVYSLEPNGGNLRREKPLDTTHDINWSVQATSPDGKWLAAIVCKTSDGDYEIYRDSACMSFERRLQIMDATNQAVHFRMDRYAVYRSEWQPSWDTALIALGLLLIVGGPALTLTRIKGLTSSLLKNLFRGCLVVFYIIVGIGVFALIALVSS